MFILSRFSFFADSLVLPPLHIIFVAEIIFRFFQSRQTSQGDAEDLRVQHNIAVAQYYAQGCHEPQKLLEQLEKTKKKMEERRKQHGADSAEVRDLMIAQFPFLTIIVQEGVYVAALEGALLGYNEAFLLASTKHYSSAIGLLEPYVI